LKALRSILLFLPLSPRRATPKSENCSEKIGEPLYQLRNLSMPAPKERPQKSGRKKLSGMSYANGMKNL